MSGKQPDRLTGGSEASWNQDQTYYHDTDPNPGGTYEAEIPQPNTPRTLRDAETTYYQSPAVVYSAAGLNYTHQPQAHTQDWPRQPSYSNGNSYYDQYAPSTSQYNNVATSQANQSTALSPFTQGNHWVAPAIVICSDMT